MDGLLYQVVVLGGKAGYVILNGDAGLYGALVVELIQTAACSLDAESVKYGPIGTDLGAECLVQIIAV